MQTIQQKILFILKNSKTKTTGYYQMNSYVANSELLKKEYQTKFITLYSNSNNKFVSFIKLIIYSCSIFFKILRYRPSLIYFTISPVNTFYRDLIYVFILKLFKIQLVYHLHGKGIATNAHKKRINLKLYNWAYKNVNVILVSEKLKYDIDFLPVRSIYIVPNAIPEIPVKNFSSKTNLEANSTVRILFLSNLIKSKGILDFIDALQILKEEKVNFHAHIVGKDIDIKKDLLISKMGHLKENVTFHGSLYGDEKNNLLSQSHILVFPTLSDIWGIVILEAMQFGLPVITTDEGAITDMIEDSINGFIIKKNNPEQIAKKIEILITNPDLRKKMGDAGRAKFLEKYTLETFEQNMLYVFNKVINNLSVTK